MASRAPQDNGEAAEPMMTPRHHEMTESPEHKIKDTFFLGHIVFYALGTAMLIPSNFFTTATDYWMYKFRNPDMYTSSENRTELQAQFTSSYSIVSNVSNIAFLILTILFIRRLSMTTRIIITLSGVITIFLLTVIFVRVNTDVWQKGFFVTTLISGFLLTACSSTFMVTGFELVTRFPKRYLATTLTGQALTGILAALVQILCLSIGADPQTNGIVYFCIGMGFVAATLVAFLLISRKQEFFRYYMHRSVTLERPKINKEMFVTVLGKIKIYLMSLLVVLGASTMTHPGLASLVVSVNKGNGNKWNDVYFVPVITFLVYHVVDYIGRELAAIVKKPMNGLIILAAAVCRVSLVPLIMFCNAQPRSSLPVALNTDYDYIICIIVFGFTNGYLVNLCVILIPTVTTESEKTLAIVLIMVFMIVGMGILSFLGAVMIHSL